MLLGLQSLQPALQEFMQDEAVLPSTTSTWTESKSILPNEWAMIDSMVALLGPFYRVTEFMSANKMLASLGIVQMKLLKAEVESMSNYHVHRMIDHLMRSLDERVFSKQPCETTGGTATVQYNVQTDSRYVLPHC